MAAGGNQYEKFSLDSNSVMKSADGKVIVNMQVEESRDSPRNKQLVADGAPRVTGTYWMIEFDCVNHTAKILNGVSSSENGTGDLLGLNGLSGKTSNTQSPVGKIMVFACMPAWHRWLDGMQDSL